MKNYGEKEKETIKKLLTLYGIPPEKSASSLSAWQLCMILYIAITLDS